MTLMVESIGFSGTHFCADVINSIPKHIAFHATRNPYKQTDIGVSDLVPNQFVEALLDISKKKNKKVVSIHSLFSTDIKNYCKNRGVGYKGLIRDPRTKIESCFAWYIHKFQNGSFLNDVNNVLNDERFNKKIKTEWDALYIIALRHIVRHDLVFLKTKGLYIGKIEEISNNPSMFKEFFELECDVSQVSEAIKKNSKSIRISHQKKVKHLFSNIKIDRDLLVSLVMQTSLNHLACALGYKSN